MHDGTGWLFGSGAPFQKLSALYFNYYYYGSIFLTVFMLITYDWVSMLKYISRTKNRKNTLEESFGILGTSTEPENNTRVKIIVESEIDFLLEFYQCSSE